MEKQTIKILLIALICLTISLNIYWITHQTNEVKIEYKDKIIEKECLLNCSENGNQINCKIPDNKNLTITKVEYYTSILK